MPYKRKKVSALKKLLIDESFIFVIFLVVLIFLVGAPERVALRFFIILESFNISRIAAALIWTALCLVISVTIFLAIIKVAIWNNKHLNQDVVKIDLSSLRVFNYKKETIININDIKKISIMNKDSIIKIEYKEKNSISPDNLVDNRKTFDSLKEILSSINPDIVFYDSSISE